MKKNNLELYIHIPFCLRKCLYCDFLSSVENTEKIEEYVSALEREIRALTRERALFQNEYDYHVSTIFFGGGTPSVLSGDQVGRIMGAIRDVFSIEEDAEVSMEVNPGTVTSQKLKQYKEVGINRISFGLQSANDDELKLLGRIHTYEEFVESYCLARECGFENINVDLMSAIPNQTWECFETSLNKVIELHPEHISVYSLIIEEGTPFAKAYGEGMPLQDELPTEEEERRIYYKTKERLQEAGYQRYEISNYAKEKKECRHNLGYWDRTDYLGLGLGSSSLIENVRFKNTDDVGQYIKNSDKKEQIRVDIQPLSVKEQMEEFFFLGLRKMEGVSKTAFEKTFGITVESCYGEALEKLKKENLLIEQADRIQLTEKGIDISNYVFAELLY